MAKLVKHGSQGVADGTPAKDIFDMPETAPLGVEGLELSKNTALYDKEAGTKSVPEIASTIDDVATDKSFVEVSKGTIAPQQAGSPDTPLQDSDQARFANQGAPDYEGKKDSLDSEESLKQALGHKTSSGL
jgi:hypothetical protein